MLLGVTATMNLYLDYIKIVDEERLGDNRLMKKILKSTWEDSDWG